MGLGDLHHTTPKKSKIIGAVTFAKAHKLDFFHSDVFRENEVCKQQGWKILHDGRDRRHLEVETRGRPKLITPDNLQATERIIWQYGFQARALTWQGLALEAGISGISARTIERAMGEFSHTISWLWSSTPNFLSFSIGTLGYRKCIAWEKGFVSPFNAERRTKAAQTALFYHPRPEDWHDIRWSDEVHFAKTSQGRVRIIRKYGERYCPDCIHHAEKEDDDEIRERYHVWGAIGWNFKSELTFYEVPTNTNGKMSMQVYQDVILNG